MNIGFCGKPNIADQVAQAGFDYLEPPVNALAAMSEADFDAAQAALRAAHMPTPSFNLLFPRDLALLAAGTTDAEIAAYLRQALPRVARLGGRVAVFGSGRSRQRPEGMPYGAAFRRLTEVTRLTGDIAAENGLTIVIEPLNRGESNMINSLAEGAALAAAADHPNVALLADYYHIALEHEPPEDIARLTGIAHAHIATEVGRRVPVAPDDGYRRMFAAMKQTGYTGLLSVEGKSDDLLADGPVSVRLLKQLWEEA